MGTEREKPQPRVKLAGRPGNMNNTATTVEFPFTHYDGWNTVSVGWSEDDAAWVAYCSAQSGACGVSETSQLHAMAELVRSLAALCDVLLHRETELHRAIHDSPDALAKELRGAERDLHKVQAYITTHVEASTSANWDAGLQPLWRAERALTAFAARIATPATEDAA